MGAIRQGGSRWGATCPMSGVPDVGSGAEEEPVPKEGLETMLEDLAINTAQKHSELLVWEGQTHGARVDWMGLNVGVLEVGGLRRQDALEENGFLPKKGAAGDGCQDGATRTNEANAS